jgi:hypothetical protein
MCLIEILFKEDARCLPCSTKEEKLASSKLVAFSKSAGSVPMRYDAQSYKRYNRRDGKGDTVLIL